ncbi:MAG TPA: hypothetical protein DCX25_03380 [Candidatus Pacebacteria bacterium]|nr:MAG: hypothetical protein UX00_C0001G0045 [Microgenomates group bacterium GW2011_GWB1_45_17]KKU24237.1 MAG: hypothetical protein UX36_C0002G0220 [Microgenomates group bacterium GW2011_GWC1_46_15]KKU24953.1 MAG: hypothetical protein UX35_C0001G0135 [Microgenomates group bacterium GW2011_GWA1_46_15]HAV15347.1 hypothetical protein [Candidatus Paceibacterota bacterium]HCR11381.1 hypothetical protein [Candidatus Paceibacterota bacterium]
MAIANDWRIDYTNKLIVHATSELAYQTQTVNYTVGDLITQAVSGATAVIVADVDGGATGTLHIAYVTGTFNNTNTITDQHTGSAAPNIPTGLVTKTATYTTRALYSYIQDTFDELVQLDDTVPMSAQTPTEFTLINGWFIDDNSVKFLYGGALQTSGYDAVIQMIAFGGTYTPAINSDIGKMVNDDTVDSGNLLHFNNTTKKWWVRWGTQIASGSAMTLDGSGTGAGTTNVNGDITGEDLYANVYTLGSIATNPNPQTYIFQNSASITPWWGRGDVNAAIDVLIKVKELGSEIDGANITVYVRHYGDLYDHFAIDLTNGGRNAVPLSSATDLNNNTLGEAYLLYDGQGATNFTAGLILTNAGGTATAEIIADTDNGANGYLTLGNVKGTFADGEIITDTSTGSATVNGSVGDTVLNFDTETAAFVALDQIVTGGTSLAQRQLKGIQDDAGATGRLVLKVSDTADADHFKTFSDNEIITGATNGSASANGASTTAAAGFANIKTWFVNVEVDFASKTGSVPAGSTVTGATSGAIGVFLGEKDANTLTIGNWNGINFTASEQLRVDVSNYYALHATLNQTSAFTMNKAFTQGTNNPYSIIVDCANRSLSQVYEWLKYITRDGANSSQVYRQIMYPVISSTVVQQDGEEYIAARVLPDTAFTPVKASPFGTFAGGKLFGAQGVWVQNMVSTDVQSFQLIDSNGATRTPPNFQSLTVTGVISGDKVAVFRTTGGTTINKAVFTLAAGNNAGNSTIVVNEAIPTDTPSPTGVIRLVDTSDTSINRETKYTYTSWDGGTKTFSGVSPVLDRNYTLTDDTAYVPYIDTTASGTSVTVSVIYPSADRTVLARVRRYNGVGDSILPFETTGTYSSTGYSTAAIRTSDSIVL